MSRNSGNGTSTGLTAEQLKFVRDNPDAPLPCGCNGGCTTCGNTGSRPAWTADPEITGYPHERNGH